MPHTIDRYHDISAGHRVSGHESKCAHLHGHNYRIFFQVEPDTISGSLDNLGRVIDFSVIKTQLCEWLEDNWDHKMLIWEKDPMYEDLFHLDPQGIFTCSFNPTAENMAEFLVNVVAPVHLENTGVRLVACRVEETRKCAATYYLEDADA
jgi:6-pyruvoyltetrahydropterin/6-carboxytetrahydropterin synthase